MAARGVEGIMSQRALARVLSEAWGKSVHHDTIRNYLHGLTSVHPRFLHQLDKGLKLTHEKKNDPAQVCAWGQTKKEAA
jgi:hypothetical protein